jgi:uncharacterized protein (UPF0128 family)
MLKKSKKKIIKKQLNKLGINTDLQKEKKFIVKKPLLYEINSLKNLKIFTVLKKCLSINLLSYIVYNDNITVNFTASKNFSVLK